MARWPPQSPPKRSSNLHLVRGRYPAVRTFTTGEPIAAFTEVESGKSDDRPQLAAALAHAKRHKATLVIAKLDRLARDVHFISGLLKSGVEIRACDIPTANRMVLHIMAAVAEGEREMISERTKAALAAAKARGVRLGTPDTQRLAQERRAAADAHAHGLRPVLIELWLRGITGVREMAAALNAQGISTSRGGHWHPTSVQRLLERTAMLEAHLGRGSLSGSGHCAVSGCATSPP